MTKHYQIGKRFEWKGGDCPVAEDTRVRVWFACDSDISYIYAAYLWRWDHIGSEYDIIAFEVVVDEGYEGI
jgi:hypothetical protein